MLQEKANPAEDIVAEASTAAGVPSDVMARVVEGLRDTIVGLALSGDSVAIPRFGTFMPVKEGERVSRDLSTGRNVLLPPHLDMRFTAASALRRAISINR